MWPHVVALVLHVAHLCTWTCTFSPRPPSLSFLYRSSLSLHLVIHSVSVAAIQLWLSYLPWFMRLLCKMYQGRHLKTTPFFPTFWLEKKMQNQKRWVKRSGLGSCLILLYHLWPRSSLSMRVHRILDHPWIMAKAQKQNWLVTVPSCREEDSKTMEAVTKRKTERKKLQPERFK